MYASPDETLAALESVGYFTDQKTATTVYLAGKLHRPIMLEGPAGAGKTELATSVSRAYKAPILRLQCYQGINEEKAIGQYDKSLQKLYVLLMSKSDHTPDWTEIKREVTSRAYFMAGPLLEAIEQDQRCVLLIDEIDKVDYAFEAMLLELLSAWTLSIPKMGTVQAKSVPYVFLTSNQERRLGDPLRRRSFYLVVEHPTAEREGSTIAGLMECFGTVVSVSLQHGVPLKVLCDKLSHTRFEPSGWTGNEELGYAKSIMDYLFRWTELRFLSGKQVPLFTQQMAVVERQGSAEANHAPAGASQYLHDSYEVGDAPLCVTCGSLMVRNGSCHKCGNCGGTSGCS